MPAQAAPFNQIVYIGTEQGGCSGTYIGWRTLLTAAHCVVSLATGARVNDIKITPYRNGPFDGPTSGAPYGTHFEFWTRFFVPGEYITRAAEALQAGQRYTAAMMPWDFAVVTFAQTPGPLAAVGWNGFSVNGFSSGSSKSFGYPGQCPGAASAPMLCGMSGTAYTNGSFIESANIDFSGGQSGGPWMLPSNHVVGVNIVEWAYRDFARCGFNPCVRNFARRLDSGVWNYITVWSADW